MGSCQRLCNSQPTCKSLSFNRVEGKCLWSTSRMAYDPNFVFNAKPQKGKEYLQFPGLVFHQTGWLKSEGKSEKECATLCNNAAACRSFSYRGMDKLCLLSEKAIGFHDEYNYYEKEGLGHREFALHAKNHITLPNAKKKKAGKAAPANAASEGAIKAALKAAMAAGASQKPVVQNGEPASVVAERLRAVKKWAEEKLTKKGEESAIAMVDKVKATAKAATVASELQQARAEKKQASLTVEKASKQVQGIKEVDAKKQVLMKKEAAKKAKIRAAEEAKLRLIKEKNRKANKKTTAVAVSNAESKVTKKAMTKAKEVYAKTAERHEKVVAKEKARKKTRKLKTSLDKERAQKATVLLKKKLSDLSAAQKMVAKEKIA